MKFQVQIIHPLLAMPQKGRNGSREAEKEQKETKIIFQEQFPPQVRALP